MEPCRDTTRDALCFPPFQEPGQALCDGPPPEDWTTTLPPLVDLDQLLRMEAVNALIANNHSLFVGATNYWVYNSVDGRHPRVYLPWDLDTVMRLATQALGLAAPRFEFQTGLLARPDFRSAFVGHLDDLLAGPLSEEALTARIETLRARLGPHVAVDTQLDLDETWDTHVDALLEWWTLRRDAVRSELDACCR